MKSVLLTTLFLLLNSLLFCQTANIIPIDSARWYQVNNASNVIPLLFNNKLEERVHTGWDKMLANYQAYYPILNGEHLVIDSLKMYDWEGVISDAPMKIFVINNKWEKTLIATFTGEQYNTWVGPNAANTNNYGVDTIINDAAYIMLDIWNELPSEIVFYGSYTAPENISAALPRKFPLKNFMHVNAFEWDIMDPTTPWITNNSKVALVKGFTGIRHYLDWQKIEQAQNSYTYNPSRSGGWHYDTLYQRLYNEGIEVLACIKTIPEWINISYPENERDIENVPAISGADLSAPSTYLAQAKMAFQYAARYGSNSSIDSGVLTINSTQQWTGDGINTIKIGLGLVKYMECDNERDKWWKGRKAYQTGREYAANLSAFYDGHLGTLGSNVGVKNADTSMQVVMAGTASTSTDYLRGMIDWCKQYRGYKPDGKINLCWDIINYHHYASDAFKNENGLPTRGVAPELSTLAVVANNFIETTHKYCYNMAVWVTETGYDVNQGSPYKAIPIGNKTELHTQADWLLRTSLLYARSGIEKVFFYQLYDDNSTNTQAYASSGLVYSNLTRKPSANIINQVKKIFGEAIYVRTISTNPFVDEYILQDSLLVYALTVGDEIGKRINYTLTTNSNNVTIYKPNYNGTNN